MSKGIASRILRCCALILCLAPGACRAPQPVQADPPPAEQPAEAPRDERPVDLLARWMTGWFTSSDQSAARPGEYFDIHLRQVPIWTDRNDGPWLYVEQAAAARQERPYRQRIYRLIPSAGGMIESRIYLLPGDALAYAGAWRDPRILKDLTPEQLEPRVGCSVFLQRELGVFAGATRGTGCSSTIGEADYTTAEVVIGPDRIIALDRGFAADGRQVWGATDGGYEFQRISADASTPVGAADGMGAKP